MSRSVVLLAFVLASVVSRRATAHPCPSTMAYLVSPDKFWPKWNAPPGAPPGSIGISELFKPDGGVCGGCHNPGASHAYAYKPCGNCHRASAGGIYPDWLDFTTRENLLRQSYYLPGATKAEASLIRSMDGTMPPGARPSSDRSAPFHGWCDEIRDRYMQWVVDYGMQP